MGKGLALKEKRLPTAVFYFDPEVAWVHIFSNPIVPPVYALSAVAEEATLNLAHHSSPVVARTSLLLFVVLRGCLIGRG
jgi:hypothetical protein